MVASLEVNVNDSVASLEVPPSETSAAVIVIVGAVESITKASLPASESEPPTVGSVRVALALLLLSTIVPPFSASAVVAV